MFVFTPSPWHHWTKTRGLRTSNLGTDLSTCLWMYSELRIMCCLLAIAMYLMNLAIACTVLRVNLGFNFCGCWVCPLFWWISDFSQTVRFGLSVFLVYFWCDSKHSQNKTKNSQFVGPFWQAHFTSWSFCVTHLFFVGPFFLCFLFCHTILILVQFYSISVCGDVLSACC